MNDQIPTPRLSIVIATWNAAHTFERCIASITSQSFTDWELIVSDGGSTDGTVELIKKHAASIAWWRSAEDAGIYDAWNQALDHANGDYVCFLGADDTWETADTLKVLFSSIGSRRFDLVTSRGRIINPFSQKQTIFGSAWNYRRLGRHMVVCHPGLLHDRSLFGRFGKFNSHYKIAGDLDFLLRLPEDLASLHVNAVTVTIQAGGISRKNVLARLREQRVALSQCPRYGPVYAQIAWIDKLWRYPIARWLGISH